MNLSLTSKYLIQSVDRAEQKLQKEEREVNPLVSELASWYEKLRNALEYQEEEVILRAAIARILRRRIVLGKKNEPIAEPLIRELIWAKYFPENTIPQKLIKEVQERIDLYLQLRDLVYQKHKISHATVDDWINQLMSSDIENLLQKTPTKDLMISFIFKIFKGKVYVSNTELEQTKDAQVYIAIRRAFAKEDIAMLRYSLFVQIFGELTERNVESIAEGFLEGYKEVNKQLNHPQRDRVYNYIKRYMPPFFILRDIFEEKRGHVGTLVHNENDFEATILKTCNQRYQDISRKISTAVVKSILFVLLTKTIFALLVESSFERLIYDEVNWMAIGINIASAPFLMFITTLFITSPKKENSYKIVELIKNVLVEENPSQIRSLSFEDSTKYKTSFVLIYGMLWLIALGLGVFAINWVLNIFEFTLISKAVFFFFLAVVSFMCYRISQIPRQLIVQKERQGVRSLIFDFFFVPFIQVGKTLTVGISQINIFIFIFDYLIEAPFKEMFAFIEQWFFFLRSQRESID